MLDAEKDLLHIQRAAMDRGMLPGQDVGAWILQNTSVIPLHAELRYCRVSAEQVNVGVRVKGEWMTSLSLVQRGEKVRIYECGAMHPAVKELRWALMNEKFIGASIDGIVEYLVGEGWKEVAGGE